MWGGDRRWVGSAVAVEVVAESYVPSQVRQEQHVFDVFEVPYPIIITSLLLIPLLQVHLVFIYCSVNVEYQLWTTTG